MLISCQGVCVSAIIAQLSAYLCTFHEHSTSFKRICFLNFFLQTFKVIIMWSNKMWLSSKKKRNSQNKAAVVFCCSDIFRFKSCWRVRVNKLMRTEPSHQSLNFGCRKKTRHIITEIYMSNTGRFLSGCQTFYLNILSQKLTSCTTLNVKIRSVIHSLKGTAQFTANALINHTPFNVHIS